VAQLHRIKDSEPRQPVATFYRYDAIEPIALFQVYSPFQHRLFRFFLPFKPDLADPYLRSALDLRKKVNPDYSVFSVASGLPHLDGRVGIALVIISVPQCLNKVLQPEL